MWRHIMIAVKLTIICTLALGVIYPLAMTGLAQVLFPRQANGSLIRSGGAVIGSELLGQQFARPEYFHPRPSAAGRGYDAAGSGGSNLGPTSKALVERTTADVEKVLAENPGLRRGRIPADMVTASASGLDPNISVANAYAQAARIAAARGVSESEIRGMIGHSITGRQFGTLGEPRVNVLRLNLALDAMTKARHS
jgi:K+-transporting ATPase ATPase C chain